MTKFSIYLAYVLFSHPVHCHTVPIMQHFCPCVIQRFVCLTEMWQHKLLLEFIVFIFAVNDILSLICVWSSLLLNCHSCWLTQNVIRGRLK